MLRTLSEAIKGEDIYMKRFQKRNHLSPYLHTIVGQRLVDTTKRGGGGVAPPFRVPRYKGRGNRFHMHKILDFCCNFYQFYV